MGANRAVEGIDHWRPLKSRRDQGRPEEVAGECQGRHGEAQEANKALADHKTFGMSRRSQSKSREDDANEGQGGPKVRGGFTGVPGKAQGILHCTNERLFIGHELQISQDTEGCLADGRQPGCR